MRSRILLNVFLLATVLALSGVVLLSPEKEPPISIKLTDIEPADIETIRIERPHQETIELKKKARATWWLSQPVAVRGNAQRIEALLDIASTASHTQLDAHAHDLARFGLDRPRVRLRVGNRELFFGDTEPLSGRRYVLTDDRVHLITDQFYHYLNGTVASFVNPVLLEPEAVLVELELPDFHLTFNGTSWEKSPAHKKLNEDAASNLIDAWKEARAISVSTYDTTLARENVARVRLEGQESSIRFDITSESQRFVLGRPDLGIQYELDPNAAKHLLSVPDALSDS